MRSVIAIVLAVALGGCSFLDELEFGGSRSLNPNRTYLGPTAVVSVTAREAQRYACVNPPLVCVQHGVVLQCHCP